MKSTSELQNLKFCLHTFYARTLFLGSIYSGPAESLKRLFEEVKGRNYRIIGPKIHEGVIRIQLLERFEEIPYGYGDEQAPGHYRLSKGDGHFRNGPDSPKYYLYPPELILFIIKPDWSIKHPGHEFPKTAFFGIKPCDLAAIKIMDKVHESLVDSYYLNARMDLLLIVENCISPGHTCFCATMRTGPTATYGFDIAYTRLDNEVLFQPGSDSGVELLTELDLEPASVESLDKLGETIKRAAEIARGNFSIENLPETLEANMESEVYNRLAERCFGCANCNMVCPTCFCFDVLDEPELDGSAKRVRIWDGCHSYSYAQVAGGHFRKDLWARYRHWILHKFIYWLRQFGSFGCVGCGRCITWCPAGIDIREVVSSVLREAEDRCKR